MPVLDTQQRSQLERTVIAARDAAEVAALAALERLAVNRDQLYEALSLDERELRIKLRAKGRQLGSFGRLVAECAYEYWHRMLFARFLAENELLMHPAMDVPVTLEECAELALDEGVANAWVLAERYAAVMLPQIFRPDDSLLQVVFAPEHQQELDRLLASLPAVVFTADDSIGWVYQFWQARRKDAINASGVKIGADEIGPVTQLFTEHYMVQFLLHNTLGAWWVARHPGETPPDDMEYLRRLEDGTPAAGAFTGWPATAKELRILDPCCGSGHFLVTALDLMVKFRMREEGLSEADAAEAVLRDNLFGLEIDQRCTQIAAFALAFAAWKRGGYRLLGVSVACSGTPVGAKRETWMALAKQSRHGFMWGQLYDMFKQAPELGSLIDPKRVLVGTYFSDVFPEIQLLLMEAMKSERDDDTQVVGVAAQGIARAAELLMGRYHLVTTNVPYLARGKQNEVLAHYCNEYYNDAKADLATVFIRRGLNLCSNGGAIAFVTPQNWTFLGSYRVLRERLLNETTFAILSRLGAKAFQTPMWDFNVGLFSIVNAPPHDDHHFAGVDASTPRVPNGKADILRAGTLATVSQAGQLRNPDARIMLEEHAGGELLGKFAACFAGILNGDSPRFQRMNWEIVERGILWTCQQSTVNETIWYGGRERLILYDEAEGHLREEASIRRQRLHDSDQRGNQAWGKKGICVSQMGNFAVTLYTGEKFDSNVAVIFPFNQSLVPAIWAYCNTICV